MKRTAAMAALGLMLPLVACGPGRGGAGPSIDGDLYIAVLAKVGRPPGGAPVTGSVETKQVSWENPELDLPRILSKYKMAPPYPSATRIDSGASSKLQAQGYKILTDAEVEDLTQKIFKGTAKGEIWKFSSPIVAPDGKAAVMVEFYCGGLCGGGSIFILEKKSGAWKVIDTIDLWMS
jgi:hypothetical protein